MLAKILDMFVGDIPIEQRTVFMRLAFRGIFILHIVWACGWLVAIGLPGFAQAGEVDKLRRETSLQIAELRSEVSDVADTVIKSQKLQQRTAFEAELRRLNQEVFSMEARLKELSEAGLRADRIYSERIADLKIEIARVEARLSAFLRANPNISETF